MPPTTLEKGAITDVQNVATYVNPMLAVYQGRAVNIIATGDSPGHSPVCQGIDAQGQLFWGEQADFRVIDTRLLPNEAALKAATNSLGTTGTSTR